MLSAVPMGKLMTWKAALSMSNGLPMGLEARKAAAPTSSMPATMHRAVPTTSPTVPMSDLTYGERELLVYWLAAVAKMTLRTTMMATPEMRCSQAQRREWLTMNAQDEGAWWGCLRPNV